MVLQWVYFISNFKHFRHHESTMHADISFSPNIRLPNTSYIRLSIRVFKMYFRQFIAKERS